MKPVRTRFWFTLVLLPTLIVNLTPVQAGDVTLQKLLSGEVAPLTLTFKDLDSSWRKFSTASGGGAAGGAGMAVYLAMLGGGGSSYYTKGDVKMVDGEPFLIAYRPQSKPLDVQAMFRGGMRTEQMMKPEPPTSDTPLVLSLIHLRTVGNLADVQPFNLERELAGGDDSPEALKKARDEAAKGAGLDNLRQLGMALMAYAQDGNKTLPPMNAPDATRKALKPYVGEKDIFSSENGDAYLPNPFLSGKKLAAIEKPADMVAFYEAKVVNGTRGVLFLDGHVLRISEEKWAELKDASHIP